MHLMHLIPDLRAHREAAGYRQSEVAARMGVTQATISRWETNATPVGLLHLARIAELYDCQVLITFDGIGALNA